MKLKVALLIFAILSVCKSAIGQELDENSFDFWVGHWQVAWANSDGIEVRGTNEIVRILHQKVIQENFIDPSTNFKGTSITVYNPTTKTWHQAWADSAGTYYDFEGELVNGMPSFKTKTIHRNGEQIIQRMVFKNIQKDAFTWIWEGTKNGGESWNELWKISYRRM
nr:hypothetical protein [uncultured bacterium]